MAVCKATTQGGKPCRMQALRGRAYCYTHSPTTAPDRARSRKLGGQRQRTPHAGDLATIPAEIRTLQDAGAILRYALAEILAHENSLMRARVLIALYDSFLKSFEIGEIEQRLAALEARGVGSENHHLHKE